MQLSIEEKRPAKSPWQRFSSWLDRERILGPVLVAPAIILLVVLIAYPFGLALFLSVSDRVIAKADTGNFVGLANFVNLIGDSIFRQTVVNTLNYALVSVVFKLVLGMLMALVLNEITIFKNFFRGNSNMPRKKFLNEITIFKNFFRGILLLPWIVPTSLSALGWLWMFDSQYSIFNRILMDAGIIEKKIVWLGTPFLAMFSVQVVNIWRGIPFFGISLLAGLQTIPQDLYEAAEIDGASSWSRFWHVTTPLLMPVTVVVTLFSIVQTFADFQIVYVLTRGGPVNSTHLFATLAHQVAILAGQLGRGAAISLFMFPVLVIAVILQLRYLQRL